MFDEWDVRVCRQDMLGIGRSGMPGGQQQKPQQPAGQQPGQQAPGALPGNKYVSA